MKNTKLIITMAVLLMAASKPSYSLTESPAETQGLYYLIGGGEALREPLNIAATPKFGLAASLKGATSCDAWDGFHLDGDVIQEMVEDHIQNQVKNFSKQIIVGITAYAQGAIALAVQRAMPEMYDFAMQVDSQLSGEIEVAKMSCETAMENLDQGISPFDNWISASGGFSWANSLNTADATGDINILEAEDNASNEKGEVSVPWVNGELKGGEGEEPILVVHDATLVGYAAQAGAGSSSTDEATSADGEIEFTSIGGGGTVQRPQALAGYWASSGQAAEWAKNVLGETTISYCATCTEGGFEAGKGLQWAAHQEQEEVVTAWNDLYATVAGDPVDASIGELRAISSTRVQITRDVIVALSNLHPQDKRVYIRRLASDVAMYRTIEKGMALRRILKASLQEPGIQTHKAGVEEIEKKITELEEEVQELVFDVEIGSKLVSSVPTALFAYDEAAKSAAMRLGNGFSPNANERTVITPQGPVER